MVDHHSGLFSDVAFYKKFSDPGALDLDNSQNDFQATTIAQAIEEGEAEGADRCGHGYGLRMVRGSGAWQGSQFSQFAFRHSSEVGQDALRVNQDDKSQDNEPIAFGVIPSFNPCPKPEIHDETIFPWPILRFFYTCP